MIPVPCKHLKYKWRSEKAHQPPTENVAVFCKRKISQEISWINRVSAIKFKIFHCGTPFIVKVGSFFASLSWGMLLFSSFLSILFLALNDFAFHQTFHIFLSIHIFFNFFNIECGLQISEILCFFLLFFAFCLLAARFREKLTFWKC